MAVGVKGGVSRSSFVLLLSLTACGLACGRTELRGGIAAWLDPAVEPGAGGSGTSVVGTGRAGEGGGAGRAPRPVERGGGPTGGASAGSASEGGNTAEGGEGGSAGESRDPTPVMCAGVPCAAGERCTPLLFEAHGTVAVGALPVALSGADIDGDGDWDLITINQVADDWQTFASYSVLLNDGNATFASTDHPATGRRPSSVALLDVNDDGCADLVGGFRVVVDRAALALSACDGRFVSPTLLATGDSVSAIEVGDLDGDMLPDVVTANTYTYDVSVFYADGSGGLTGPTHVPACSNPSSLAFGDLDADQDVDIAVGCWNLNGAFVNRLYRAGLGYSDRKIVDSGTSPSALALADLNGDRAPDLISAGGIGLTRRSGLGVTLGGPTAQWGEPLLFELGERLADVVAKDFDRDSRVDLAVVDRDAGQLIVLLGDGTGALSVAARLPVGNLPQASVAADLNGDALLDLAVVNQGSSDVTILLGTEKRACQSPP